MPFSEEVKVLSVNQVTDVLTGHLVYQIGLGRIGKPIKGLEPVEREISSNVLIVFLPTKGECPYKAGSKWTLTITDTGGLTLKEKK
jgi:hypothetical protein